MSTRASNTRPSAGVGAEDFLRWSAVAAAVGFGTHAIDHVRRGMSAATMLVMLGGGAEAVAIVIAVVMVLARRRWAARAAIVVGFGTALASTYGHVMLTDFPVFHDSVVSPPHIGVTWYSWVSLAAAIGTGLLFGCAGVRALRAKSPDYHRSIGSGRVG